MAWDAVIFGTLLIPERHVEEWLTEPLARELFALLDESDIQHETPEALFSFLQGVAVAPHELFDVTLQGGKVHVQCYLAEDAYFETNQALALLFLSAAAFHGVGELFFYGYRGIQFGERLTVKAGRFNHVKLNYTQLPAVEKKKGFIALGERIHDRFNMLVGRTRKPGNGIHPFTGRQLRVVNPR